MVVIVSACSKEKLGGYEVTLRFLPSSPAVCGRVYVTNEANEAIVKSTDAIPRKVEDLKIGVGQSLDLGETVNIRAHGYATTDCVGPWTDDSNVVTRTFVRGKVIDDVLLVLDGRPVVNSDGGVELCDNTADDDGDGLVDCADTECEGRSCGAPNACVNGQCVPATTEVDCTNGLDDDSNGATDCADLACAGHLCSSGNACLTNKRCIGMQCGGDAVMCPAAGECQMGAGMCQPDGGPCTYAERTGSCGDGGTCAAGRCTLSFPFTPTNIPKDLTEAQVGGALRLDCGESRYDTDTGAWTNLCANQAPPPTFMVNQQSGAPVLRVMGVRSLDVLDAGALVITGSLPLAIAVLGDATVGGRIQANAADGGINGAGSPGNGCGNSAGANGVVGTQSGGGGAGHGELGGRGGHADGTNNTGGAAGVATSDVDLSPLRGGCAGGFGGIPSGAAAAGGGGGGAFQLSVAGRLTVNGRLVANGGGGQGGPATRGGGGGGGSGGGILLEATGTTLTATARVLALGGGGGGGAENAVPGEPGQDGTLDRGGANGGTRAGGNAGHGGDGADFDDVAQVGDDATNVNAAGGGGGGALGRIVIHGSCSQNSATQSAPVISTVTCGD